MDSALFVDEIAAPGQTSVCIEGIERPVHVVVKAHVFTLTLRLVVRPDVPVRSFKGHKLSAVLVYDTDPIRPVDYLKDEPLQYTVKTSGNGCTCVVEAKLGVLSSKYEDANFRILFELVNPTTKELIHPALTALSEPIKVVSKPEQVYKEKGQQKRQSSTEKIYHNIAEISAAQKQLSEKFDLILSLLSSYFSSKKRKRDAITPEHVEPERQIREESFDDLLPRLFNALARTPDFERPTKLRKLADMLGETEIHPYFTNTFDTFSHNPEQTLDWSM